eukprot:CAMPEP_0197182564 /NCGR_PEP_ID=MMETSP1423-20130617/6480_1 /TAXON_ID=476441 /ORGANISM="Pseudo-nitzschia heimii, Strain UNC1101" /LENGTH=587 /DNA_ID=CAMNT_0042633007 /DNA_START=233 /DNA_END=1996 /DNA_ORIENTATION=-
MTHLRSRSRNGGSVAGRERGTRDRRASKRVTSRTTTTTTAVLVTLLLVLGIIGFHPCSVGASRSGGSGGGDNDDDGVEAVTAIALAGATADATENATKSAATAVESIAVVPAIPSLRQDRFPSVDARVKLYMSNWYAPPCEDDPGAFIGYALNHSDTESVPSGDKRKAREWPTLTLTGYEDHPVFSDAANRTLGPVTSMIAPDLLFLVNHTAMISCGNWTEEKTVEDDPGLKRVKFRKNMRMYCVDVVATLFPAWWSLRLSDPPDDDNAAPPPPPILMQFGDNKQSHVFKDVNFPHIKKFRSAAVSRKDLAAVAPDDCRASTGETAREVLRSAHGSHRFQPIVWKLATDRHFRKLRDVYRHDRPWHRKIDRAVFKGALTGSRDGYDKTLTPSENCHNMRRCRLVYETADSTLVDATLTRLKDRLPKVLDGVTLFGNKTDIDHLLQYKAIIMIEGNDVASGLKWALLSQSVIMMAPPKHTSWAMEELLEPWVHYVPLDEFATNVEERMRWIIDHDEEARRIAERSTLWMEDMVFHPDAMEDDRMIQTEILRRYEAQFRRRRGDDDDDDDHGGVRAESTAATFARDIVA